MAGKHTNYKKLKKQLLTIGVLLLLGISLLGDNALSKNVKAYAFQYLQELTNTDTLTNTTTQTDATTSTPFTLATITKVADGDTVWVSIHGTEEKIRMIGIDTPESVHMDAKKNTPQGKVASDFTKEYLPVGTTVYLEYDTNRTDPYDRTLAYIWLRDDVDTTKYEDFCNYNYGAILLQKTYCKAKYYAPNGKYKDWYEQLEQKYQ